MKGIRAEKYTEYPRRSVPSSDDETAAQHENKNQYMYGMYRRDLAFMTTVNYHPLGPPAVLLLDDPAPL